MAASLGQLANTPHPESIDILLVCNGRCDCMLRNVFRNRQLDEDTVDCGVVIEGVDALEELRFGNVFGKLDQFAVDVCLTMSVSTFLPAD